MTSEISQMSLEQLVAAIRTCTRCGLHSGRTRAVPGEGPPDATIMFIGEGPGFHEDRQGRPFVGSAGKYLEELLASIGLKREQVYITNVVKCRPPGNRDPLPDELAACKPYLDRQIELIAPKVIVTLGRYSMARYFPGQSISRIHGQARQVGGVIVVAMLHPAAALHQPQWKATIEADFKKLPAIIAQAERLQPTEPPPSPQQLSLF
ncbi:MAG: uracil-DNA glycosylase [Anaerolineae bacterium]|nr:uracil-DNA glycosylase [Anaerolineae bacterium]MDW8071456.1 uracil-DNA glycosylase [Anaerolineae bacterium]